jgi:hypothetical protein
MASRSFCPTSRSELPINNSTSILSPNVNKMSSYTSGSKTTEGTWTHRPGCGVRSGERTQIKRREREGSSVHVTWPSDDQSYRHHNLRGFSSGQSYFNSVFIFLHVPLLLTQNLYELYPVEYFSKEILAVNC